jgi:hypothetical protein
MGIVSSAYFMGDLGHMGVGASQHACLISGPNTIDLIGRLVFL